MESKAGCFFFFVFPSFSFFLEGEDGLRPNSFVVLLTTFGNSVHYITDATWRGSIFAIIFSPSRKTPERPGGVVRESPPKGPEHSGLGIIIICPDINVFFLDTPSLGTNIFPTSRPF